MKTPHTIKTSIIMAVMMCAFGIVNLQANDYENAKKLAMLYSKGLLVVQPKGMIDKETLVKLYDMDRDCVPNREDSEQNNPNNDSDNDGISNIEECINYSDPLDANSQPLVFKIKVRTSNPGSSNNRQFEVPVANFGHYRYNIDCDSDGNYEARGVTGGYMCNYRRQGDYTISIIGTYDAIFFNNEKDKDKLLEVVQWGKTSWISMRHAFAGCSNMTVTASDTPDLSDVRSMRHMFKDARTFNAQVNNWDTSNVTDMEGVFMGATSFNSDIFLWDTSNVTTMKNMFNGAIRFNRFLSVWDMSSVEVISGMFKDARAFNSSIFDWNLENVVDMSDMFRNASNFNQNISRWDTSSVINMSHMFRGAIRFNQSLNSWDTSSVFSMVGMFQDAERFNQTLVAWDTSSVTQMDNMFNGATSFDRSLGSWNISRVTSMDNMFRNAKLSSRNYGLTLIGWNTLAQNIGVESLVHFHGGESTLPVFSLDPIFFASAIKARNDLVSTFGWTITDADSLFQ